MKTKRRPRIEKRFYRTNSCCCECDKFLMFNPRSGEVDCPNQKTHDREEAACRRRLKRLGLWDHARNAPDYEAITTPKRATSNTASRELQAT